MRTTLGLKWTLRTQRQGRVSILSFPVHGHSLTPHLFLHDRFALNVSRFRSRVPLIMAKNGKNGSRTFSYYAIATVAPKCTLLSQQFYLQQPFRFTSTKTSIFAFGKGTPPVVKTCAALRAYQSIIWKKKDWGNQNIVVHLNDRTCLTSVGVSLQVIGPELGPQ